MAGMAKDASTRMNFFARLAHFKETCDAEGDEPISVEARRVRYTDMANEAFDEEEGKA